jgi:hypothetical protein
MNRIPLRLFYLLLAAVALLLLRAAEHSWKTGTARTLITPTEA